MVPQRAHRLRLHCGRCWPICSVRFGAQEYCKSLIQGGSLAIVDDCNLMRPLWNHIVLTYGKSEHWLGALDRHHEGSWIWVDGSTVTMGMPFWAFDQPDNFRGQENCLEFSHTKSGYFNDQQCSREVSFVCQAPMSRKSWPRQNTIHILESLKRNSLH